MSNYPPGVTDDDPHFDDDTDQEDEEPEREEDITAYHYGEEADK